MDTVLITGCSSGIGRATAEEFRRRGWTVYATARDETDLADLAEEGCETAALDVTDGEQVTSVVERVVDETGSVDCLVNNAGYGQYGAVEDVPLATVHEQFDVNVYGPHRLHRAVLPHMRGGDGGTIVNVSSVGGMLSWPLGGAYTGSKHALEAMTDALRMEVDAEGVDVVLVEPGPVETGFHENATAHASNLHQSEAYADLYDLLADAGFLRGSGPFGVSPTEVATVIADAASVSDPGPRYRVGDVARGMAFVRHLPDRWLDAGVRLLRWVLT